MTKYLVTNGKGEFYSRRGDDYDYGSQRQFASKIATRKGAEKVAREGNLFNILFGAADAKTHPYEVVEVRDEREH